LRRTDPVRRTPADQEPEPARGPVHGIAFRTLRSGPCARQRGADPPGADRLHLVDMARIGVRDPVRENAAQRAVARRLRQARRHVEIAATGWLPAAAPYCCGDCAGPVRGSSTSNRLHAARPSASGAATTSRVTAATMVLVRTPRPQGRSYDRITGRFPSGDLPMPRGLAPDRLAEIDLFLVGERAGSRADRTAD